MPKQTIEADVPKCVDLNKWEVVCFGRCRDYPELFTLGIGCQEVVPVRDWGDDTYRLILRRKEPVRESRWGWSCCSFSSCEEARATYPNVPIVREDLIDGKLVAVTLEPLGEGGGE